MRPERIELSTFGLKDWRLSQIGLSSGAAERLIGDCDVAKT
jgi:hypothetical protein